MSRKKQVYEKITALYCRISLDDGGDNESMSISNLKLMLRDFAEKHGMFQYENSCSGTSQKSMGCSNMSIMWMTAIRAAISTVPRSSA